MGVIHAKKDKKIVTGFTSVGRQPFPTILLDIQQVSPSRCASINFWMFNRSHFFSWDGFYFIEILKYDSENVDFFSKNIRVYSLQETN